MPRARDFLTLGRFWFTGNLPPCKLGEAYLNERDVMSRPHGIPLPRAHRSSGSNETESAFDDGKQGQPRPREGVRQLTGAERVRTLVESNASVSLMPPGAHDLGACGTGAPTARPSPRTGTCISVFHAETLGCRAAAHVQDAGPPP